MNSERNRSYSLSFLVMCTLMTVCLITSNLFTIKVFTFCGLTLTADLILFPISYIINDCISEIYGYRKTRLAIWLAFSLNFFFVLVSQLAVAIPSASFWDGGVHFDYVFTTEIRVAAASLVAFFVGSTVNAAVMSRMKIASGGRYFAVRAIVSSIAGDLSDSLVFIPVVFIKLGFKQLMWMVICQVLAKVLYEILFLPLTHIVVKYIKKKDATDVYDWGISYNPFSRH